MTNEKAEYYKPSSKIRPIVKFGGKAWPQLSDKNAHEIIDAINRPTPQSQTDLTCDEVRAAINDFNMAEEHWASGETFVPMAGTCNVIKQALTEREKLLECISDYDNAGYCPDEIDKVDIKHAKRISVAQKEKP